MKNKYFICIIGLDGSGKTSVSKKLVAHLNKHDKKSIYVWGGYKLYLLWPFIRIGKIIFLKNKDIFKDYKDCESLIKETTNNSTISLLYERLTLLEYFLQVMIKIRLPLILGKTVISDRYFYDTIVSMATTLNYSDEKFEQMLSKNAKYLPKPDFTFFVDVPIEVAYKRKEDIPSIDYLNKRLKYYKLIDDMIILDGEFSIDLICDDIIKNLNLVEI